MSFTPPGVTPSVDFGVGVHPACILTDFKQAKSPEKFSASVVYIATYRDTESGALRRSHRVDPTTGKYRGRQVLDASA